MNYKDIFILIICFESLQVLFTITAKKKLKIHLINIQNTYLNSDLDKKLYMNILEDITVD